MKHMILTANDLSKWKKSAAYYQLVSFYVGLNEDLGTEFMKLESKDGVERVNKIERGKSKDEDQKVKKVENMNSEDDIKKVNNTSLLAISIGDVFTELKAAIDKHPCVPHPRFGNPAFRSWHSAAVDLIINRIKEITFAHFEEKPISFKRGKDLSVPEYSDPNDSSIIGIQELNNILSTYLIESLGNSTRIDYGTGHELNFLLFLYCLEQVNQKFAPNEILPLLTSYFDMIRTLIIFYKLEPAGSHGAWGLDDYQFMPFLLGSGQLKHQSFIHPAQVFKENLPTGLIFFDGISFINKYKTGNFAHHSPILYDICMNLSWPQINQGLLKMHKAEVLEKFPVVQHLYFCVLFPFPQ